MEVNFTDIKKVEAKDVATVLRGQFFHQESISTVKGRKS